MRNHQIEILIIAKETRQIIQDKMRSVEATGGIRKLFNWRHRGGFIST